jgi:TP901 family phage tail tape measure protein
VSTVANIAINVDSRGAVGKLREVQSRTSSLERATNSLTRSLAGLATAFGATFALGKIINDVARLDTNLRRLGTVGGDVQGLSKALDQVGKNVDGIAGKAELAAASYQALSAGFTETAQNAKVVEAATKAAVGGLVDVTSVVEVTTKTLNAYGMSGNDAIKVTDSISKAIEYGQVQWSDYTSQLGRVASIAAVAGVSLDEVNAFIAAATKNGATAEVAFTGLGATLSTLLQPTKSSQEAAKELGIAWNLSGLQAQGFDGLIEELGKKMGTNQEAAVRLLGSQEALRGAFAAASKGGQDYTTILEGLGGAAGKTQSDFDAMKGSVENQIKALNTAFTALGVKLFEVFGPTLTDLIKGTTTAVTNTVDAFNALPEPVKKGATELVRLIAQLLLVKKALEGIIALRTAFVTAMVAKAGAIASTGTAAKTSASAFALYTANTKTLQAQAATATPVLRGMLGVLRSLALIGVITVGVDVIVKGIGTLMQANAELAKLRGEQAAGGAAATFQGADRQTVLNAQKQAQQTLQAIKAERKQSRTPGARVQQAATGILGVLAPMVGLPSQEEMAARPAQLRAREQKARDILNLPVPAAAKPPTVPTRPFRVGDVINESTVAGGKVGGGGASARTAGAGAGAAAARDAQRAADAAKREAEQRRINLRNQDQLVEKLKAQIVLQNSFTDGDRIMNQLLLDQLEIRQDIENRMEGASAAMKQGLIEEARLRNQLAMDVAAEPFVRAAMNMGEALAEGIGKAKEQTDLLKESLMGAGDIIGNQLRGAIDGLIDGTADWNNILRDTLSQLGSFFLNFGLNQLAGPAGSGGILSFLGFGTRANGGPVNANQPYIVGERGPELFVPFQQGSITSNEAMQQASMAQLPFTRNAESISQATQTAQAMQAAGPINVKYESTVINGMTYVTEDQHRRGMAQAAERGRALTLQALQNSPRTRSKVGI